jgi:predicted ATPase
MMFPRVRRRPDAIPVCPDPRDLERLALGQLPEAEAGRLGRHILSCAGCARLLDSLHGSPTTADSLSPHTAVEAPPASVGRYQIVGRPGAGGMGVVYPAHDPQLERDVAVKLPGFHGSDEGQSAVRQRFLREARAAAAVRHPHVCPIYDVGENQGRPYVVMALVEGETLGDRLRRQGRFEDARAAVALVLRVADALAAVHAAHIIHRDLKPGNILLDRAGEPFLADFGLARGDDGERLTAVGQLLGTPAYMAPEQAAAELGPVGPWSDQYSLGVVLYEMLTGRLPFEGTAVSLLFQIGTKPVPPPSQYRPDLDAALERLLLKALARRAQDRHGSVANFASALRGWWEGSAAPPRRKVDARRRRLTMLQCGCDLFESEALLTALDPEEQHALLRQFQQLCRDVAAELEGTVVKATDRGLLVCFGFPLVLESPARQAVRAGLEVLERLAGLNEGRYQFKHALIQDAAYQSLLRTRRQQFHGRIAEVLEERFPEMSAARPELLAQHFTEGDALPRAVAYWERAGERAQQRGAVEEAVGHFTRGLELLRSLPETRQRQAQEIRLQTGLGVALAAARGYGVAELEAAYARAHALGLQAGLTAEVFPALFGRLRYCINRARYAEAQRLAEEMLRLAEREGDAGFLVSAHCGCGWALVFQGKHTEALPHLERVVAVEATAELRSAVHRYVVVDPWVSAHLYLSLALWLQGFPERAAEHSRQALGMAERLGHPFSLGFALSYAAWLHQFRQDRERTRTTAARALTLGTENGFAGVSAWGRILCGWAAEPDQGEAALAEIRQGLEELREQAALRIRHEMLPLLAEACARAGRPGEGLPVLAEALEFADATGESFLQAETHRLKGELLLQHDPTVARDAEVCFHQALEVARRQQARSLELRAALSLARLWDRQGKTQAAEGLLAPVHAAFTEGFQTHDWEAARALLERWRSGRR